MGKGGGGGGRAGVRTWSVPFFLQSSSFIRPISVSVVKSGIPVSSSTQNIMLPMRCFDSNFPSFVHVGV